MEEVFEFVRSPAQSRQLAEANIPAPLPIMSNEVLDENILLERIDESLDYLHCIKERRHGACTSDHQREAKRFKAEAQASALVPPLLRIIQPANGNGGGGVALVRQDVQQLQRIVEQQFERVNQQLQNMERRSERQFENLQFNMGALACNSSALIPQAPIRPLKNNDGNIPRRFPVTRGAFEALSEQHARNLLAFYGIPLPEQGQGKGRLASHIGLRAD